MHLFSFKKLAQQSKSTADHQQHNRSWKIDRIENISEFLLSLCLLTRCVDVLFVVTAIQTINTNNNRRRENYGTQPK